jgi:hypothetical protein
VLDRGLRCLVRMKVGGWTFGIWRAVVAMLQSRNILIYKISFQSLFLIHENIMLLRLETFYASIPNFLIALDTESPGLVPN